MRGFEHLTLGQRQARGLRHLTQSVEFLGRGFFVDPEQKRRALGDERFGGADIGEHHEFLDQAMGVQPLLEGDGGDRAILAQFDAPFWQVQLQRLPPFAGRHKRCVSRVKRTDHIVEKRRSAVVGCAILRGLDFFVMQARRRAHQGAVEGMANLLPIGPDDHAHGKHGAVDTFVQAAQIARQRIGQHRHDPVGEIGGIAPLARLAVQRRSGAHVMGHIGDGDPDDVAAVVAGIGVGMGVTGIVVIAGIGRIDGDERQIAEVFPALHRCGFGGIGLGHDRIGEGIGNAVFMDRDKRHGARRTGVAQTVGDARPRQAHARLGSREFPFDQLAVFRAMGVTRTHDPFLVGAFGNGLDAPALGPGAENAEDLARVGSDLADQLGGVMVVFTGNLKKLGQDAVAFAHGRIALARGIEHTRRGPVAIPVHRTREQIPIAIGGLHDHHTHGGELAGVAVEAALFLDMALVLQLLEHALEVDPRGALDPEGLGDIALGAFAGVVVDPGEEVVFGGKLAHGGGRSMGAWGRHGGIGGRWARVVRADPPGEVFLAR